jgi:hypothetical protein
MQASHFVINYHIINFPDVTGIESGREKLALKEQLPFCIGISSSSPIPVRELAALSISSLDRDLFHGNPCTADMAHVETQIEGGIMKYPYLFSHILGIESQGLDR